MAAIKGSATAHDSVVVNVSTIAGKVFAARLYSDNAYSRNPLSKLRRKPYPVV
jgi:hypothetical protein